MVGHGPVERAEQCQRNTLRQHTVQTIAGVEPDRVIEPEAMVWLLADQVRPSAPTRLRRACGLGTPGSTSAEPQRLQDSVCVLVRA